LQHRMFANGAWYDWFNHGVKVYPETSPAVTASQPDDLDIYIKGQDGHLWGRFWVGYWTSFVDLGGILVGGPAAFQETNGRVHVIAPIDNGRHDGIWYRHWQPW
ncbi:MAG TPA: hypothetical protein VFQ35_03030, partial [Polyangiaceae bacterium]|nr:hypothetical protein [Polyangiaceae bacterium]